MLPDLNYYPDEENYTAEQSSGSNFLTGIFPNQNQTNSYQSYDQTNSYQTYDQTNSYQTYDQTNFCQTYDQTNSYPTYDRTNSYQTYDRTNSYQTYDQTNSYPTYDQTNLYPYPAIYSNNIIYQQLNPAVPLYNFFGCSSSSTSGCNLADNIGRNEKQNNIDGRSSVDPTIMELSDDHDDQDEQDDGGPYYSNEEET
jgi:homoserine acetyltransferase